ncbi:hypothetical protein Leryth_020023, partial [Lithospermum erythrorhizon]
IPYANKNGIIDFLLKFPQTLFYCNFSLFNKIIHFIS